MSRLKGGGIVRRLKFIPMVRCVWAFCAPFALLTFIVAVISGCAGTMTTLATSNGGKVEVIDSLVKSCESGKKQSYSEPSKNCEYIARTMMPVDKKSSMDYYRKGCHQADSDAQLVCTGWLVIASFHKLLGGNDNALSVEDKIELRSKGLTYCEKESPFMPIYLRREWSIGQSYNDLAPICNQVGGALLKVEPVDRKGAEVAFLASCNFGFIDSCKVLNEEFMARIDIEEAEKRLPEIKAQKDEIYSGLLKGAMAKADMEMKQFDEDRERSRSGLKVFAGMLVGVNTVMRGGSAGEGQMAAMSVINKPVDKDGPSGAKILQGMVTGVSTIKSGGSAGEGQMAATSEIYGIPGPSAASGGGAGSGGGRVGPDKPYSSWTQEEQRDAGSKLKQICESRCSQYIQACKGGGIRPCKEASACTKACFVNNAPSDWPSAPAMRESARADQKEAKRLGSNAPVFLP